MDLPDGETRREGGRAAALMRASAVIRGWMSAERRRPPIGCCRDAAAEAAGRRAHSIAAEAIGPSAASGLSGRFAVRGAEAGVAEGGGCDIFMNHLQGRATLTPRVLNERGDIISRVHEDWNMGLFVKIKDPSRFLTLFLIKTLFILNQVSSPQTASPMKQILINAILDDGY